MIYPHDVGERLVSRREAHELGHWFCRPSPQVRIQIQVCGWAEFWARVTCAAIFVALSLLLAVNM